MNVWISEYMKRALASKAEEPPPEPVVTRKAHYIRCKGCGACAEYHRFIFHGARLQGCTCKLGGEEWVKVAVEVPVGEPEVRAP